MEEMESELERLIMFGIYRIRFYGYGRVTGVDGKVDPWVEIFNNNWNYNGYVVVSNDAKRGRISNMVRDELYEKREQAGEKTGRIIKMPRNDSAQGPYWLVGSEEGAKPVLSFYASVALSVLKGNNCFYARYVQTGNQGGPALCAYRPNGKKLFGFLRKTIPSGSDSFDFPKKDAAAQISAKLIETLKLGDHVFVTLAGQDPRSNVYFFNPIINLEPKHMRLSCEEQELITHITDAEGRPKEGSYRKSDYIKNILALKTMQSAAYGQVGIGYLPKNKTDVSCTNFYKKVIIIGAKDNLPKLVNAAAIIDANHCEGNEVMIAASCIV
ncbi:MAG: hypothetical protein V1837_05090 [Candidatus Woesearchaeota archaeon]